MITGGWAAGLPMETLIDHFVFSFVRQGDLLLQTNLFAADLLWQESKIKHQYTPHSASVLVAELGRGTSTGIPTFIISESISGSRCSVLRDSQSWWRDEHERTAAE